MKNIASLIALLLTTFSCKAQFIVFLEADSTNFETNTSMIQLDSSVNNIWQIGLPQKTFFGNAFSPPFAIMTDTINSYPINNLSSFTVSIVPTLAAFIPDIMIGFWHKYKTDFKKDGGYLEISLDSGATWINAVLLDTVGGISIIESTNFYTVLDTIHGGILAFSGDQNNWQYSEIFLQWVLPFKSASSQKNRNKNIMTQKAMVRFIFKSDQIHTNKEGWIIDNLIIGIKDIIPGSNENKLTNFAVKFFPNPVNKQGIFQIISKNEEHDFTLKLYNNAGQMVVSAITDKNNQYILKTNEFLAGMYIYKISNKNGDLQSGKIIIK